MPEKDRFSEFLSFLSDVWKFLHLSKAEPEKLKLRAGENRQPDLEQENAEMGREKAEVVQECGARKPGGVEESP